MLPALPDRELSAGFHGLTGSFLRRIKQQGFSDFQIANLTGTTEDDIRVILDTLGD